MTHFVTHCASLNTHSALNFGSPLLEAVSIIYTEKEDGSIMTFFFVERERKWENGSLGDFYSLQSLVYQTRYKVKMAKIEQGARISLINLAD